MKVNSPVLIFINRISQDGLTLIPFDESLVNCNLFKQDNYTLNPLSISNKTYIAS